MFGRQWPWEFFPSRAVLDYPPSDLVVDLSKKLLLGSPFGIAWLSLPWSIRSILPTACSGWTSPDVVVLLISKISLSTKTTKSQQPKTTKSQQPKTTVEIGRLHHRGSCFAGVVVAGLGLDRSEKRATPWVSPWWWLASVGPDLRKEPWVSPEKVAGRGSLLEMEMVLLESDSDDEMEILSIFAMEEERLKSERASSSRRGSIVGRKVIKRDYLQGEERLFHDYFSNNPVFPPHLFRRRFRMSRPLFFRLQSALEAHDPYFIQKRNAAGTLGLSSLQKMTAALRILAYGVAADSTDEYVRIGESTAIESLKRFVKAVVNIFSEEYLRSPNSNDIARLLAVNEKRGFPGMLGSIDCMHWKWKNCPTAWKEHSSIFTELAQGRAPPVNYSINGHDYTMGYYLADGIYPQWSTFVKTISAPLEAKKKHFARVQEACRKDVECAFGILQARFSIVRGPARFWDEATLNDIMKACIILHNMIIEDERDPNGVQQDDDYEQVPESIPIPVSREPTIEVQNFIQSHIRIRDRETHSQLQADLVEHLWQLHGQL
uniref:DDE Tnp4 domain-containing protein n=1 Tax=Fagus sylvatica TaxID=28930 RepID=A0A2N9G0I7_FAGSY